MEKYDVCQFSILEHMNKVRNILCLWITCPSNVIIIMVAMPCIYRQKQISLRENHACKPEFSNIKNILSKTFACQWEIKIQTSNCVKVIEEF